MILVRLVGWAGVVEWGDGVGARDLGRGDWEGGNWRRGNVVEVGTGRGRSGKEGGPRW